MSISRRRRKCRILQQFKLKVVCKNEGSALPHIARTSSPVSQYVILPILSIEKDYLSSHNLLHCSSSSALHRASIESVLLVVHLIPDRHSFLWILFLCSFTNSLGRGRERRFGGRFGFGSNTHGLARGKHGRQLLHVARCGGPPEHQPPFPIFSHLERVTLDFS